MNSHPKTKERSCGEEEHFEKKVIDQPKSSIDSIYSRDNTCSSRNRGAQRGSDSHSKVNDDNASRDKNWMEAVGCTRSQVFDDAITDGGPHQRLRKRGCPQCGELFDTRAELDNHKTIHKTVEVSDNDNECSICHKIFSKPEYLTIHKSYHELKGPHRCWCGVLFDSILDLNAHSGNCQIDAESVRNSSNCDIDNRSFGSQSALETLKAKRRENESEVDKQMEKNKLVDLHMLSCLCGEAFPDLNGFLQHCCLTDCRSESSAKVRKCQCGKFFLCAKKFSEHVASSPCTSSSMENVKNVVQINSKAPSGNLHKYSCGICSSEFFGKDVNEILAAIKLHALTHSTFMKPRKEPPSFKCPDCDYRSSTEDSLNTHRLTHTLNITKTIECLCYCSFSNIEDFSIHQDINNCRRDYVKVRKCECGIYFVDLSVYIQHISDDDNPCVTSEMTLIPTVIARQCQRGWFREILQRDCSNKTEQTDIVEDRTEERVSTMKSSISADEKAVLQSSVSVYYCEPNGAPSTTIHSKSEKNALPFVKLEPMDYVETASEEMVPPQTIPVKIEEDDTGFNDLESIQIKSEIDDDEVSVKPTTRSRRISKINGELENVVDNNGNHGGHEIQSCFKRASAKSIGFYGSEAGEDNIIQLSKSRKDNVSQANKQNDSRKDNVRQLRDRSLLSKRKIAKIDASLRAAKTEKSRKRRFNKFNRPIFDCEKCGRIYFRDGDRDKHIERMHKDKDKEMDTMEEDLICKFCTKTFSSKLVRNTHEQYHLTDIPLKCDICADILKSVEDWKAHSANCKMGRQQTCETTQDATSTDTKNNEGLKSDTILYKCSLCGLSFVNTYACELHRLEHSSA